MLDDLGYEIPDPTPVELPARLRLPSTRAAQIQGYIRAELSRQAAEQGQETFEEANDLDVDEQSDFGITEYERSAEFGVEEAMYMAEFDAEQKARLAAAQQSSAPAAAAAAENAPKVEPK